MGKQTMEPLRCRRCGHGPWVPRRLNKDGTLKKPKVCPECKRTDWEKEPGTDGAKRHAGATALSR